MVLSASLQVCWNYGILLLSQAPLSSASHFPATIGGTTSLLKTSTMNPTANSNKLNRTSRHHGHSSPHPHSAKSKTNLHPKGIGPNPHLYTSLYKSISTRSRRKKSYSSYAVFSRGSSAPRPPWMKNPTSKTPAAPNSLSTSFHQTPTSNPLLHHVNYKLHRAAGIIHNSLTVPLWVSATLVLAACLRLVWHALDSVDVHCAWDIFLAFAE
ncbi:hypothetical protein Hypma_002124 [Hypsizygus marmoreus]|uniref:Uncharacterized protein n=1 Tax=Hypsizygus marmoreus TaxID=39966 RepID=A0A369K329_HYPMA|nr:hypothetical protein Hypma_002124 [Hypsizygus marmoreus]